MNIIDKMNQVRTYLIRMNENSDFIKDPEGEACLDSIDQIITECISMRQSLLDNVGQREGYKYLIRELEDKLKVARNGTI